MKKNIIKFISFIIPFFGFTYYFLTYKKNRKLSVSILKLSIIGLIVWLFGLFIYLVTESNKIVILNNNIDDWKKSTISSEYTITILGRSDCSHCQEYLPIINSLKKKYNLNVYFYETDLISDNDLNILLNSYNINFINSVPYTFVIKNNTFIADYTGFISMEATLNFLTDNGVIN